MLLIFEIFVNSTISSINFNDFDFVILVDLDDINKGEEIY